tara:strand:- start:279 stop:458 length:180 start_codon:yes stop_codon:yes gene_type:complete
MAYPTDPIYKLFKNIDGVEVCVLRKKNGIIQSIPFDEANTDYQEYLAWVAEGNTPEEAD